MKLSIVVPVYNEKNYIREIIERIHAAELPGISKEIIVVDDGSTDGTGQVLRTDLAGRIHKLIFHQQNQGKGAAIRTGFEAVSGEVVVIQDADLEYDPAEYRKLLQPIIEGKADVVYGSRFVGSEPHRVLYFWHYVGNKILTTLSNMFTNLNLTDMETCYKMFRATILTRLHVEQNRFGFEPEITAKLARGKWRIYEVGISYSGRNYAEGKKIVWKDGLQAMWCIVKYNLFR